jgi:hypothetical protein
MMGLVVLMADGVTPIDGFSKTYRVELDHANSRIKVINTSNKRAVIEVHVDPEWDMEDARYIEGAPVMYDDQSVVYYEDFNFDGHKDFALQDGRSSCYGGASYRVYLYQKGRFVQDKALTKLAQEKCGMFDVDSHKKTIETMAKSGCCYHEYDTYGYQKGKLTLLHAIDEYYRGIYTEVQESLATPKGTKYTKRYLLNTDDEAFSPVVSFELAKNAKRVYLLNNRLVTYALTDKENVVEFAYPKLAISPRGGEMHFSQEGTTARLTFENASARYTLYQNTKAGKITAIGIKVTIAGKVYDLKGDITTRKGDLREVAKGGFPNLITQTAQQSAPKSHKEHR